MEAGPARDSELTSTAAGPGHRVEGHFIPRKKISPCVVASEPSAESSLIEKFSLSVGPWHMLLCMPREQPRELPA